MNKLIVLLLAAINFQCFADGVVVDRVYHPYVLANERKVEWRFMSSQTDKRNLLAQRLGFGQAIAENVLVEAYAIAERDETGNFDVQAYELEGRWMITEQGQYWADWGALVEFEKHNGEDNFEATLGLLMEKEFDQNSLTLNLFAIREWGSSIPSEWESEFRLQYRYRYLPEVQPAVELYAGEDFVGIGPAIMGIHRFVGQKQLKWEAGFITEVAHSGKNHTLRIAIEYEF
ncbi:hypothetical protein [Colwellia sp. MEBiC06753]